MRRPKGTGIASLAAIIVEAVISDYQSAPPESAAYRSAKKFLRGEVCSHLVCEKCSDPAKGWRSGECPPADLGISPCVCGHAASCHAILEFDWAEHRDLLAGAAGVNPSALRRMTE